MTTSSTFCPIYSPAQPPNNQAYTKQGLPDLGRPHIDRKAVK